METRIYKTLILVLFAVSSYFLKNFVDTQNELQTMVYELKGDVKSIKEQIKFCNYGGNSEK